MMNHHKLNKVLFLAILSSGVSMAQAAPLVSQTPKEAESPLEIKVSGMAKAISHRPKREGLGPLKIHKILKPLPGRPEIALVLYSAGRVGTSHLFEVLRGVVVHLKTSQVLADEIYQYIDDVTHEVGPYPKWNWSQQSLLIESVESEKPIQVRLP